MSSANGLFILSGDVAQMGEHLSCTQKVVGSMPAISTKTLTCIGSWRTGCAPVLHTEEQGSIPCEPTKQGRCPVGRGR